MHALDVSKSKNLKYLPLKECLVRYFNKFDLFINKDGLCQVWLKSPKWFLRRNQNVKSAQTDR